MSLANTVCDSAQSLFIVLVVLIATSCLLYQYEKIKASQHKTKRKNRSNFQQQNHIIKQFPVHKPRPKPKPKPQPRQQPRIQRKYHKIQFDAKEKQKKQKKQKRNLADCLPKKPIPNHKIFSSKLFQAPKNKPKPFALHLSPQSNNCPSTPSFSTSNSNSQEAPPSPFQRNILTNCEKNNKTKDKHQSDFIEELNKYSPVSHSGDSVPFSIAKPPKPPQMQMQLISNPIDSPMINSRNSINNSNSNSISEEQKEPIFDTLLIAPNSPTNFNLKNDNQNHGQQRMDNHNNINNDNQNTYLDGYNALTQNHKQFLQCIRDGKINKVKTMIAYCKGIRNNINFNEQHVLRECVLSNQLKILKLLKCVFTSELDLNGQDGYIIRWAARRGNEEFIDYLLLQQQFQKVDINHFDYQCINWAIEYGQKRIAKKLQKFYKKIKELKQKREPHIIDVHDMPSVYEDIMHGIMEGGENGIVNAMKVCHRNGCDMRFENDLPWTTAVDCRNIGVLTYLHLEIGVSLFECDSYFFKAAVKLESMTLIGFAKNMLNYTQWTNNVNVQELREICENDMIWSAISNYFDGDETMMTVENTEDYDLGEPQSPQKNYSNEGTPHTHIQEDMSQFGVLTRSQRKKLVSKGLADPL